MSQRRMAILVICCALVSFIAATALAQAQTGTINGVVRVSGGDPIAGAAISVTNQATGVKMTGTSSAGGSYEFTNLPPGYYSVSADVQGFKGTVVRDQKVDGGSTHTVNIAMQVKFSESVTVTAMKREETVFSTPVSVAAPTEEDLRDRGADSIEQVAANVGGFSVQNLGPGQSTVAIRGVSSGQIARDQPGVKEQVGAYLDESVISLSLFTPDMDLFDMNRVEVLRGPQGTLFGSGSEGGTVRYISNQPQLGANSVFAELGGNDTDGGGFGGSFKAGFNTPLSNNSALRVAGFYNRVGGWADAVQPDLTIHKNVNAGDREGVRAAVEMVPIEGLTITPRFVYQKVSMDGWNREDIFDILANPYTTTRTPVTLGPNQIFTQIDEPYSDKFTLGDLNMKYDLGFAELTSITSFTNREVDVVRDSTALTASYTGALIGLPEPVYTLNAPLNDLTSASGWTQEIRLSGGKEKDRLQWVAGGFYSDANRHYRQHLVVEGFTAASGVPTHTDLAPQDNLYWSDLTYNNKQYAFFGEATFAATDKLSLTAGLRYYHYKEDKTNVQDGIFGEGGDGHPASQGGQTKADGWAPRFIASYKVTDNTTINFQAARGFRLGGVNDPINVPLCSPQDLVTFSGRDRWKDETAWNYELSAKNRFLDGRVSVNASAFYVNVKDLQVTVTAGTCSSRLIFNVPRSRSVGGDLELSYAPTDSFELSASGGYSDSEVRSTIPGTTGLQEATGIIAGNRLPSVPRLQVSASATVQQPISDSSRGYLTGTYQHVGSRYTQLADQEPGVGTVNIVTGAGSTTIGGPLTQSTFTFNPLLPEYNIFNLRMGVRHGGWDIALYCNNLTNKEALLSLDRERGFVARIGYLTNQPRTFGVTSRIDF